MRTAFVFCAFIAVVAVTSAFNVDEMLAIHELEVSSSEYFNSRMANMTQANGRAPNAYLGADVSTLVSVDKWRCLVQQGYVFGTILNWFPLLHASSTLLFTYEKPQFSVFILLLLISSLHFNTRYLPLLCSLSFAIPRGYRSTGTDDPNGPQNVKNARAGGIKYVDYYLFPCPKCAQSPAEQVYHSVQHMRSQGANFGMVWLDIEGSQYWTGNVGNNRRLFENLLAGAQKSGAHIGIYSSRYMWESIFGSGYTVGGNLPLWYAHYDNDPSFRDFRPFGGFSKPSIKQFSDKGSKCGVSYDINAY